MRSITLSIVALFLASGAALGQSSPPSSPIELKVISATIDVNTHQVKVDLLNSSTKTVVGYALHFKGLDANGKVLADFGVGWDYLAVDGKPDPSINHYVGPGEITQAYSEIIDPAVLSVQASVAGVVYADRTAEGPMAWMTFDSRKSQAKALRQAIATLRAAPATPNGTASAVNSLLDLDAPAVGGVVSNHLGLQRMLGKNQHPTTAELSRLDRDQLIKDLDAKASAFEQAAQEVHQ